MTTKPVPPNYISGKRGKLWTKSLQAARNRGAAIIVEETGEPVTYRPARDRHHHSQWESVDTGTRYDSRDCVPVF